MNALTLLTFQISLALIGLDGILVVPVVECVAKNVYFKNVSSAGGTILTLSSLDDIIYFGSEEGNTYSYNPATGERKKAYSVRLKQYSKSIIYNKKLYIGSSGDGILYEYTPGEIGVKQLAQYANTPYGLSALNDKIYIGTQGGTINEFDLATGQSKSKGTTKYPIYDVIANSETDKIYYGASDTVFELNPITGENRNVTVVSTGKIISSLTILNGRLYVGTADGYLYEYNMVTNTIQQRCYFNTSNSASSMTSLNNEIYIVQNNNIFKFNAIDGRCEISSTTGSPNFAVTASNNKIYVGGVDRGLFEYHEEINLNDVLSVNSLRKIANNSNAVILHEVNIANPNLDVSLLEVVTKTNSSALIRGKANNNRYYSQTDVYYSSADNKPSKIINIDEIIEKAVFVSYRNRYTGNGVTEIKSIKTDYLTYSSVVAEKSDDPITRMKSNTSVCFGTILLDNDQDNTVMQTLSCKYSRKATLTTKITKILHKNELEGTDMNGWNDLLGAWPFDDVRIDLCGNENIVTGDAITLDENWGPPGPINSCQTSADVEVSSVVAVLPNKTVKVTASLEVETAIVKINLKQDIQGQVTANVLNLYNEEVVFKASIKELMDNLKQSSLLPPEIVVNSDASVTVNGELTRTLSVDSVAAINSFEI